MSDQAYDSAKNDLDTIAKAFGFVVIQWGQAEQSLDLIVALLWHSFEGKQHARKIPFMLEPKVAFLRKCFASLEALHPLKGDADFLLKEFERLSALRHDLIHGAIASLAPVDGHFVLSKLDVREGYHHVREVRIAITAYPQLVTELVALGRRSHELGTKIFDFVKNAEDAAK
ncbi:MAG: hypothetical protein V4455_16850 [Pseudomonadota bacterium]